MRFADPMLIAAFLSFLPWASVLITAVRALDMALPLVLAFVAAVLLFWSNVF